MARVAKSKPVGMPTPIDVFEDNIAGAARLIALTKALENTRKNRMRRERREALGRALGVAKRRWNDLDCIESEDIFVVLKPGGQFERSDFSEPELRPLLRQAVVAIAAAVESYVGEKARCYIGDAFANPPDRMRRLAVTLGDVFDIEEKYQRRKWGYREVVEGWIAAEASASPSKIGIVFSTVGKTGVLKAVDKQRGVTSGVTERQLASLAERRNRIAHTGDRVGRKHATLSVRQVEEHYENARAIVEALEEVL